MRALATPCLALAVVLSGIALGLFVAGHEEPCLWAGIASCAFGLITGLLLIAGGKR